MTDTFDAVLADVREEAERRDDQDGVLTTDEVRYHLDRLAAAHAAEVAERDARIESLKDSLDGKRHELTAAWNSAEAAERDAGRYRWLREWHAFGPVAVLSAVQNYKSLEGPFLDAAIDAAIATTEQADE